MVKVDFSGSQKRILFHFAKTSSDVDEWVPFGSDRIELLYTKVPAPTSKRDKRLDGGEGPDKHSVLIDKSFFVGGEFSLAILQ